ncbi:hypothetical protein BTVI_34112 [Pitangus sulphuratus]|nr:hypothetical protein BTVI_34112 [Pitangus sulphuratus]
MVGDKAGSGPSKPTSDRCPRQREKKNKEQACEGFTIRAMMKNSVMESDHIDNNINVQLKNKKAKMVVVWMYGQRMALFVD